MGAAEAKACALRSTAARPTVCPCLGDSEWMDAWSRSLKSSISGSAPITAIARSKAPTARSISCGSTRTDPTGLSRCMQARKLRLSRHNPGSTCVPTGNRLRTYGLIAAAQPGNGDLTAPPTKTSEVRHWAVKHREFHEARWRHCHGVIAGGTDQKRPGSGCSEPNALSLIAARS